MNNPLFNVLNINDRSDLRKVAKELKLKVADLELYSTSMVLPMGDTLDRILNYLGMNEFEFYLAIGNITPEILNAIKNHSSEVLSLISGDLPTKKEPEREMIPVFETTHGKLFNEDSLELMKTMKEGSVDLIFADPPFNLGKEYESRINDKMEPNAYMEWTREWINDAIRLLKPGGAIFIWNLPKWNIRIANILGKYLTYRDWIAVDMTSGLPIRNHLYPSHYSLLYYIKGSKPKVFNNERIPLEVCRVCGHEIKDYGGYKNKMNPEGVNLSDVWHDIYPVRHHKYKNRKSNELPLKLLDRIISIASNPGDIIFDPFGGSGTTYAAAELNHRKWIGSEIGPVEQIVDRLSDLDDEYNQLKKIHSEKNHLFLPNIVKLRKENNYWLP